MESEEDSALLCELTPYYFPPYLPKGDSVKQEEGDSNELPEDGGLPQIEINTEEESPAPSTVSSNTPFTVTIVTQSGEEVTGESHLLDDLPVATARAGDTDGDLHTHTVIMADNTLTAVDDDFEDTGGEEGNTSDDSHDTYQPPPAKRPTTKRPPRVRKTVVDGLEEPLSYKPTVTIDKPHQCDQCNESFARPGTLKIHKAKHARLDANKKKPTNENPATECSFCRKRFIDHILLRKHVIQTHSDIRNYLCKLCGKLFLSPGYLDSHQKVVHRGGVRTYTCDTCSKVFTDKKTYLSHVDNHPAVIKHRCGYCSKVFTQPEFLRQHLLTHAVVRNNRQSQVPRKKRKNAVGKKTASHKTHKYESDEEWVAGMDGDE